MRWTWVARLVAGLTGVARELARLPQYAAEAERLHCEIGSLVVHQQEIQQVSVPAHRAAAPVRPDRPGEPASAGRAMSPS